MRRLTTEELDGLPRGIGIVSFMGVFQAEPGHITLYCIADGNFIPETPEEEKELWNKQRIESEEYANALR